jgi:S-adenosylmethionine:tRNA-ribosyltransferase-isomerase (queuine synthetase)
MYEIYLYILFANIYLLYILLFTNHYLPITIMYSLADYDYVLPPGHIAHTAVSPHHDARIMLLHSGVYVGESQYIYLPDIIPTDRVIYFNNSKVLRSRIPLKNTPIYTIDST